MTKVFYFVGSITYIEDEFTNYETEEEAQADLKEYRKKWDAGEFKVFKITVEECPD